VLIGILSDTHDRVEAMAEGMRVLKEAGARFFIHCGDVGSERVLDYLAGEPGGFVFGNTDWDRAALQRYAEQIGVQCWGILGNLTLDGKQIAVTHGDDHRLKQRLLAGQNYDYLFQGHTHIPRDERIGRTRVINPGALHRARAKTVATVELITDGLRYLTLEI
jgi:putative phosphoesterase